MERKELVSLRNAIEFLKENNDILTAKEEVDPIYEISGILKIFEDGPAVLFENIKGYPGVRNIGNIFGREERLAGIFGVESYKQLKFKALEAINKPIPPKIVENGPCQEIVIDKDVDVMATLPIIKHTEADAGRILGGGNTLVYGPLFDNGSHLSFNRMHFRGKDWSSMQITVASHMEWITMQHRGEKIPLTVNIGTPPPIIMISGAGGTHTAVPNGSDELGIAGGLQGSPIEICRAKTVDAYSVAQSEWVIEGYIDTKQIVWESEESEKAGESIGVYFPEYTGYLGRARRSYKFQATAITHRAENPIFFTPLAHSFECDNFSNPMRAAFFLQILAPMVPPGFLIDINVLHPQKAWAGVVLQIKKRRSRDEGYPKRLLSAAITLAESLNIAIVVDDDIDIYSTDDVMWALTTRVNPGSDLVMSSTGQGGLGGLRYETGATLGRAFAMEDYGAGEGIGFDATIPKTLRWKFEQGKYPVDRIDLKKWFSQKEIDNARAQQSEYARLLVERGA